jgi:hypothetical protein
VLLDTSDYEIRSAEVYNLLEGRALDVRAQRIVINDRTTLLRALKQEGPALLVMAGQQLLKDRKAFESLLGEIEVPLLLLGDRFGERASSRAVG